MADAKGGRIVWQLEADNSKLNASLTKAKGDAKDTAKEFEKAGKAVSDSAGKFGKDFSAGLGSLKGSVDGILGGMTSIGLKAVAAGAAVGGMVAVMVKQASKFEDVRANLFAVSGSVEKAEGAFRDLQDISMGTKGFSVEGLAGVYTRMVDIYGSTKDAMNATDMYSRAVSAVGGSEADIIGLQNAMQKLQLTGKGGAKTFLQFSKTLPGFANALNKMGISVEKLEASDDPFKLLNNALIKATKQGGMFYEANERQNATLSGVLEDIGETWANTVDDIMRSSGLYDYIKEQIAGVNEWLLNNRQAIGENAKKYFAMIVEGLKQAVTLIKQYGPIVMETVGNIFKWLIDNRELVKNIIVNFAKAFVLLKALSILIGIVQTLTTVFKGLWIAVKLVGTAFQLAGVGLKLFAGGFKLLTGGIQLAIGAFRMLGLAMLANPIFLIIAAIVALVALIVYLAVTSEGFRQFFIDLWNALLMGVQGVFNWIKENWQLLLAIITGPIGMAVALIITHWDTIKAAVAGVIQWIKDNWQLLLAIITGPIGLAVLAITKNWETIKNGITTLIQGIKDAFAKVVDFITAPFKAAFNAIGKFWNNSVGKLSFTLPDWVPGGAGGKGFTMPKVAMLAEGGIVTKPTLSMIGEGNEPEAVIPLSKLGETGAGGVTNHIGTINIAKEVDGEYWLQRLARQTELAGMGLVGNLNV